MNYTYKIRKMAPESRFVLVAYSADGHPDIFKGFNPADFSAAALTALIEGYAQQVVEQWEFMADAPAAGLEEGATGTGIARPRRFTEPPGFDRRTHTVEESWVSDGPVRRQVWTVVSLPDEQIASRAQGVDEALLRSNESLRSTVDLLTKKLLDAGTLTDEEAEQVPGMFEAWKPGLTITQQDVTEERVLRFEGTLYKVLQPHTTAVQWLPPDATSLYTLFRNPAAGPQPWVAPTGAHDAFDSGEEVTHDNPNDGGAIWRYRSKIDANTTEPGRDGELDRYWAPLESV